MIMIYKISKEGIYEGMYLANLIENTYYNGIEWLEIDFNFVEVQPPNAKVAKWNGSGWIVIEEYPVEPQQPQLPSLEERLQMAEDTILLLMDMNLMGGM